MKLPVNLLAALLSIILGGTARADLIDWTLNGVTFDDGGTASGTFRVNTVIRQVISWDITTTTGSVVSGHHFSSALPNQNFSNYTSNAIIVDDAAGNEIELTFDNSFGTPIANNTLFTPSAYENEPSTSGFRVGTAGAADGTLANPGQLPGGGLLSYLIVGFGGLAAGRKKAFAWARSVAAGRARLRRVHAVGGSPA